MGDFAFVHCESVRGSRGQSDALPCCSTGVQRKSYPRYERTNDKHMFVFVSGDKKSVSLCLCALFVAIVSYFDLISPKDTHSTRHLPQKRARLRREALSV